MKKLNFLSILLSALLVSGSMWGKENPEVRNDRIQQPLSESTLTEPSGFSQFDFNEPLGAQKRTSFSRKLSSTPISSDQVLLKDSENEVDTMSIVDAFIYVNTHNVDSATIILLKNIDLALSDYQTGSAGVKLNAGKKTVLDLNGFLFTSSIKTGSTWGQDDGHNACLIQNDGILYVNDNTFNASTADLLPENNVDPTQHAIIFYEDVPDAVKNMNIHNTAGECDGKCPYPHYESDAIINYGTLFISNCKIINNSKGSAAYCVCSNNQNANVKFTFTSGYMFSKYSNAVRQLINGATTKSEFIVDGGVLAAGSTCVWTQFNAGGSPTVKASFSGGKCYAGIGLEDNSETYNYYNYIYSASSLENVEVNFSGTEFVGGKNLILGLKNQPKAKGITWNILGGVYNVPFVLYYNNINLNIYDGIFNSDISTMSYYGGNNNNINIYGGTFNGDVYTSYPNSGSIEERSINISNGVFNKDVLACYSNNTNINISGGTFNGEVYLYTYNNTYNAYNCKMNISGGTFAKDVYDYCGNGNSIKITDGLFAKDISLFYSSYYASNKIADTIDIMGGYYQYDSYYDDGDYSYLGKKHWCTNPYDMNWIGFIHKGYAKEEQYDALKDEYTPYVSKDDIDYFFKLGQEKKPEGIISPITKEILVYDTVKQEYIEPKATDNVILTNNDTISVSGEDIQYGRDTIYLDTLNVNGMTFAGRDTIDVIANPGSVVVVGSSGIKASDTTTVYLTVEGGGTMKVGTEAIQKVDTVIVKSDSLGNGTLLISPNAQLADSDRYATVKLYIDGARKINDQYYVWQHIAVPTDGVATIEVANDRKKDDPSFLSYVQWWNADLASENKWQQISSWEEMNHPWRGYILTTNSTSSNVTYSFTGNIIGNADGQLHFNSKGYNFFGNSYTAPIDVQTMLNEISNGEDIEMTVWIYNAKKYRYVESNNLMRMFGMADFDEISSMQGFWLRNMTDSYGQDASVNYNNAVWSNPSAMGNPKVQAPARRLAKDLGITTAQVIVSADGRQDLLNLFEGSDYTEGFDNGSDATKLIDDKFFNLYASTGAGDLACVATNNLAGTMLSFNAVKAGEYTLSFANVNGEEYALYDMQNGITTKITEGETYTFNAVAGKNEGRFMVTPIKGISTTVGEIKKDASIEGIYTVLGQYVAKTAEWANLPSGVYVVNGQKVVK